MANEQAQSEVGNSIIGTAAEVGVSAADSIRMDLATMSKAQSHIYSSYEILSRSLKQINDDLPTYIDATEGVYLRVKGLSDRLRAKWDENVVVQLDNFMAHYDEWNTVMSTAQALGGQYTQEAVSTYNSEGATEALGDGAQAGAYTGLRVDDLVLPLDSDGRENIRNMVSGYSENNAGWSEQVANLSKEELNYMMSVLSKKAETDMWKYRSAMKQNDTELLETLKATIPPEEMEMLAEKYREVAR